MLPRLLPVRDVDAHQFFRSKGRQSRIHLSPRIPYVFLQDLEGNLHLLGTPRDLPLVQVEDVVGDPLVIFRSIDIPHNKDTVEPGEQRGLQLYLL